MCECRKHLEEKLTARFKEQAPLATGHKVVLQGYAICLGDPPHRAFMPWLATAEFPLKKGGTKVKSEGGTMFFSFCPFCGEKQFD